jgi:hypothetical protein
MKATMTTAAQMGEDLLGDMTDENWENIEICCFASLSGDDRHISIGRLRQQFRSEARRQGRLYLLSVEIQRRQNEGDDPGNNNDMTENETIDDAEGATDDAGLMQPHEPVSVLGSNQVASREPLIQRPIVHTGGHRQSLHVSPTPHMSMPSPEPRPTAASDIASMDVPPPPPPTVPCTIYTHGAEDARRSDHDEAIPPHKRMKTESGPVSVFSESHQRTRYIHILKMRKYDSDDHRLSVENQLTLQNAKSVAELAIQREKDAAKERRSVREDLRIRDLAKDKNENDRAIAKDNNEAEDVRRMRTDEFQRKLTIA